MTSNTSEEGGTARARNPRSSDSEMALPKQGSSRKSSSSSSSFESLSTCRLNKSRYSERLRMATGSHSMMGPWPAFMESTRRSGDTDAGGASPRRETEFREEAPEAAPLTGEDVGPSSVDGYYTEKDLDEDVVRKRAQASFRRLRLAAASSMEMGVGEFVVGPQTRRPM